MTAVNIVRFRLKPGTEQEFIEAHRRFGEPYKGFLGGHLVKTGDNTYCMVGQWRSPQHLADARSWMVGILDSFRHLLEDLGGNLGVTDPVSGRSVLALPAEKARKRPAAKKAARKGAAKRRKPAAKRKAPARKAPARKGAKRR